MKSISIQKRAFLSKIQNPDWCLESPMERTVYYTFRQLHLLPTLQSPVGPFFLDFAFPDVRIAIEYDGSYHRQRRASDAARDSFVSQRGWTTYRIELADNKFFAIRKNGEFHSLIPTLSSSITYLSNIIKQERLLLHPIPSKFTPINELLKSRKAETQNQSTQCNGS
jgi:hypothetical protein